VQRCVATCHPNLSWTDILQAHLSTKSGLPPHPLLASTYPRAHTEILPRHCTAIPCNSGAAEPLSPVSSLSILRIYPASSSLVSLLHPTTLIMPTPNCTPIVPGLLWYTRLPSPILPDPAPVTLS
jgi:hypothetical protein